MGETEVAMVHEVMEYYRTRSEDPGYQSVFESKYCKGFVDFMGGGYADAVASGTAALFIALSSLQLPKGSDVLVSPITDPGTLSAIILNGVRPKLVDSASGSFNIDATEVSARIDNRTSAILVVHNFGRAVDMAPLLDLSREQGIPIIEDCSQAHGATNMGKRVGSFGQVAAFSTMYRKIHMAGATGGVVFTQDENVHRLALAYADRGKPRWREDFNDRDPENYLFPALNLNTDEISCGIGIASLARLERTIEARRSFIVLLAAGLSSIGSSFESWLSGAEDAPFLAPVVMKMGIAKAEKIAIAEGLQANGVGLNPDYKFLVRSWPWIAEYLADDFDTPNARAMLDRSFFLYLNENYGPAECDYILSKIERENRLLS
jgi:dTDP-4-amino-4,6-dideoxygalactose transaminase